jgi:hypothetical protein
MMTTSGAVAPSRSVNARPRSSGIPIVEKYSGLMPKYCAEVRLAGSTGRPSTVKPTPMSLPESGIVVEIAVRRDAGQRA